MDKEKGVELVVGDSEFKKLEGRRIGGIKIRKVIAGSKLVMKHPEPRIVIKNELTEMFMKIKLGKEVYV